MKFVVILILVVAALAALTALAAEPDSRTHTTGLTADVHPAGLTFRLFTMVNNGADTVQVRFYWAPQDTLSDTVAATVPPGAPWCPPNECALRVRATGYYLTSGATLNVNTSFQD